MTIESYDHEVWITGTGDIKTVSGVVASGQTIEERSPLGQVAATGEFTLWNPAANDGSEKAVRISPFAIDTSAGKTEKQLINKGTFNPDLVVWPDSITDEQKMTAFVGTPISLQKPQD